MMMISLKSRPWQWLAWFVSGLLCTVLLANLHGQPASAVINTHNVEGFPAWQLDASAEFAPLPNPAFEEFAASHLEPNFY